MLSRAVSTLFAILIILIIIAAAAIGYFLIQPRVSTTTNCTGCFIQQPVVDVVIPELASKTDQNGGVNEQLNVTAGETVSLHVQVFTEQAVNVTLSFRPFLPSSNSSQMVIASFDPDSLVVPTLGNATSQLRLSFSPDLKPGVYSAAISAVANENSSWIWGDYFNFNVIA